MGNDFKLSWSATLVALCALVLQNTSLAILLKISFRKTAEPYLPSSVVLVTELVKFAFCSSVAVFQSKHYAIRAFAIRSDEWLILLPSCLYVIQSNLLFFGAKLLPTVVYVVCTQTKILTTAFMSRVLLGTRYSAVQYASLLSLTVGICLVQQRGDHSNMKKNGEFLIVGMLVVLAASFTSAIAGILLEKIYKGCKGSDEPAGQKSESMVAHTIWTRNVQLSLISLPFALFGALLQQSNLLTTHAFTKGFDKYVWAVVVCQASGGVIIAFVMKFANNVLKCLAVSVSICCCAVYSAATGDLPITPALILGMLIVVTSVYVFNTKPTMSALKLLSLPR